MSAQYVEELTRRVEEKRKLRASNLNVQRPDSNFFSKLDASVKKNGQLVKRIRTLNEHPKDIKKGIVPDLEKQNLRRYVEEILSALSTLPLGPETSPYILNILAHFYVRYCDLKDFFPNLVKSCVPQDASKGLDLMRFSAALNLVAGCVEIGICSVDTVINMLRGMIAKTQDKSTGACVTTVLVFLEQFGDVFLDVDRARMKDILKASVDDPSQINEEMLLERDYKPFVDSNERVLSSSETGQLYSIFTSFFNFLCNKLISEHEIMSQMEKEKHDRLSGIKSETTTESASYENYTQKRKKWDKIFKATKLLGMYLGQQVPEKVFEGTHRIQAMETEQQKEKGFTNMIRSAFDDDELAFYTSIPAITEFRDDNASDTNETGDADSIFNLLQSISSSQILTFCNRYSAKFGASKATKKKLAKQLFSVKRTSLELLPLYAKIIKVLEPEGGELSDQMISMLRSEFEKLFNERDQIKIESKVKNMRFMCELVKFKIMDPHIILSFLKQCLNEFRHHNIDITCACIENCGRFLLASEDESVSSVVKQLVDKMWRLKSVKALEEKYETMVENAYYSLFASNEQNDIMRGKASPLILYIKHLLTDLEVGDKMVANCANVVKQLRKLPYNSQPDLPDKICTIAMAMDFKYESLSALASILSALGRYRQRVLIIIVDALLERIRWNLAHGDHFFRQQGVKDIKFICELYNYQGVDLNIIEDIWYMCVSYARWNNDSPYDCYRIQLICESLSCVAHCITETNDKKRLDRFLLYFQRYVLGKGIRLPVDVEFLLADTLDRVKPNLLWPRSFAEACERVQAIELRRKIQWPGEFIPNITQDVAEQGAFDQTGKWLLKDYSEKLWPIEPEKFRNYSDTPEKEEEQSSEEEEENIPTADVISVQDQMAMEEQSRKRKARLEEMELEKELQNMVNESLSERKLQRPKTGQKLLRVEDLLKSIQTSNNGAATTTGEAATGPQSRESDGSVKMLLFMRRGKQKVREMEVPAESSLANKLPDTRHLAAEAQDKRMEQESKKVIIMNMKRR